MSRSTWPTSGDRSGWARDLPSEGPTRPPADGVPPSTAGVPVQTFLPYPDFRRSAEVLDARRLGKQRVEGLQVIRGLTVPGYGWRHHPAVRMWRGRLEALGCYTLTCCQVWTGRGHADTVADTVREDLRGAGVTEVRSQRALDREGLLPTWLGDPDFHRSHQSSLLRKDPEHYAPHFGSVPDDLPYVWPDA